MSDPYLGEIRMFAGNFAPANWAFCNGSMLSISQNTALFSLLGTTYGGDGRTNFALPDLRGRTGVHFSPSAGFNQGQSGGSEGVVLAVNQIPQHTHSVACSGAAATQLSPKAGVSAIDSSHKMYSNSADSAMAASAAGAAGGGQPHPNLQPFLCVNACMAVQGIFPSRN